MLDFFQFYFFKNLLKNKFFWKGWIFKKVEFLKLEKRWVFKKVEFLFLKNVFQRTAGPWFSIAQQHPQNEPKTGATRARPAIVTLQGLLLKSDSFLLS